MGLFNHLFKNKLPQGDEKMEEGRQTPPSDGAAGPPAESKPDHTVFLHPKAYVPRGGAAPVPPGSRGGGRTAPRPSESRTPSPAPSSGGEIILTLGDVLSRIPSRLLKTGEHDPKRVLHFKIGDLSSDIARGRAAVSLSRIAALCPDIFQKEVAAEEDMDVRLPLQKLVEQIALLRSKPSAPLPEKAPPPVSSETPPGLLPTRVPLAMRTPAKAPKNKAEPKTPSPGTPEPKSRAVSAPFTPPAISEALRENILKAQPGPLRRNPASKTGNIVPFPSIAAKAETGPAEAEEEHAKPVAESLPASSPEVAKDVVSPSEVAAQLHVAPLPAEVAPQHSQLKALETHEAKTESVSLAQPAPLEAPRDEFAKSQLLSLLRAKLHSAGNPAAFTPESAAPPVSHSAELAREFPIESEKPLAGSGVVSEAIPASAAILPAPPNLQPPDNRVAEAEDFERKGRGPALPPLEQSVPKGTETPVPAAKIDHKKSAPEESQPSASHAGLPQAVDSVLQDLTPPKTPDHFSEAKASIPAEAPKPEDAKKSELRAAEVLAQAPTKAAEAVVAGEIISAVESISPAQPEIVQTEITPKKTVPKAAEINAVETARMAEVAKPKSPPEPELTAAVSATLPAELPRLESTAKKSEPAKVDASAVDVSEVASKAAAAAALLKEFVSRRESFAVPKVEVAASEHTPTQTDAKDLHTAVTLKETENDLATAEHAAARMEVKSPEASSPLEEARKDLPNEIAASDLAPVPTEAKRSEVAAPPKESHQELAQEPAVSDLVPARIEVKIPELAAKLEEARKEFASVVAAPDLAPEEMDARELQVGAEPVFEEARKEFTAPKPMELGAKMDAVVASHLEVARAEIQPPLPDVKKSEFIPPGLLAESLTPPAAPELSQVSAPNLEAPPQAEIACAEIAPPEQKSGGLETSGPPVQGQMLVESLIGHIPRSEPIIPSVLDPVHSDIAPRVSAPVAQESSTLADGVPAPQAPVPAASLQESVSIAEVPGAHEFPPNVTLEPAVLAEARSAKPPRGSEPPIFDAPPVTTENDESISALLVSLAALTESSPDDVDDSSSGMDEESSAQDAGRIRLRLSAILKTCPKEILAGTLPRLRRNLGVELPLAQIEPQLASGAVAISSLRFISALPLEFMQHFVVREDVKVSLPIEEILRSLPEPDRQRIAQSFHLPPDATVEQICEKITQPAAEPPPTAPISSAAPSEEPSAIVNAAAEAPSEAASPSPPPIESVLEAGHSAPQEEPTAPEPEAPAAEPLAPEVAPEPSPSPTVVAEESSFEPPPVVAEANAVEDTVEPAASTESAKAPESTESTESTAVAESAPGEETAPKPFALHAPTFRVFAPPPLNVTPSIVSAPVAAVPLAWAGHVSTQPPLRYEPAPPTSETPFLPVQPEGGEPKQQTYPPANQETPRVPNLTPPDAFAAGEQDPPAPDIAAAAAPGSPAGHYPQSPAEPLPPVTDASPALDPDTSVAPSSSSVENAAEQSVLPAIPEPPKPVAPQAAPSGSPEPTSLIRPPIIRPMMIPPPPILAFTPPAEQPAPPPLSPPSGRPAPPIPSAFSSGPSAESHREPSPPEPKAPAPRASVQPELPAHPAAKAPAPPVQRPPDQPEPDSAPKTSPPPIANPSSDIPKLAANLPAERTPGPKPPKIALSVPKPPAPPIPAESAERPGIPHSEHTPAPPPPPLARFDQDLLQNLFMTDEHLDLPAICQRVSTLPGIRACVISRRGENLHAGELPPGFEFSDLLALAPGVTQIAGRLPIGTLKHFTIFAETHSVSFFERNGVQLCVVHRASSFIPGVREKLVTVAGELSKL